MLQAAEAWPMNLGFLGKGNATQGRGTQPANRRRHRWPQPMHYLPMFGSFGRVVQVTSLTFMSKADMVLNNYQPKMEFDAQTCSVRAHGPLLTCQPATVLPMAQKYFLI